jgi:ketosteroid isomerase-like protein
MRPTTLAALTVTTLALAACGGEQPAPQPPPTAPPPPATASASAPAAPADTTPPPPPKPSLAELVPQTLKGIGEAFNAHDAKKVASYYADDVIVQAYGFGEGHGKEELIKESQMVMDLIGDFKSAPIRVWIKGNVAVEEVAWAGVHATDYMGVKATKKPLGERRLIVTWFNDDGLVKEQHEYGDGAGVMAQMKGAKGAPPVPAVPTNAPEVHVAKGGPEEDKLADWARAMDETFSKDDPKAVVASTADDADYWVNISGLPATKGKKDLTKELTSWFKAVPDQKWTTTNAWGVDGFVIVEHTVSGTQKGPFGPLPATNKAVTNWHWVDVLQPSADQKLQHGWGYANLVEMMMQTGAIKPPGEMGAKGDTKGPGKAEKPVDGPKAPKADAPKADAPKADATKDKDKKK